MSPMRTYKVRCKDGIVDLTSNDDNGGSNKRENKIIKPLVALDSNKQHPRSPRRVLSLKAVLAATENQDLQDKVVSESCKENVCVDKSKRCRIDSGLDGYASGLKRLKVVKENSSSFSESMKCKTVDASLVEKSLSDDDMDETLGLCFPVWSASSQDTVSQANTKRDAVSHVDSVSSDKRGMFPLLHVAKEKENDSGLSILGEAAFLSLGIDNPNKASNCHVEDAAAKEEQICPDKNLSSSSHHGASEVLKSVLANIGSELTLRMPEMSEKMDSDCGAETTKESLVKDTEVDDNVVLKAGEAPVNGEKSHGLGNSHSQVESEVSLSSLNSMDPSNVPSSNQSLSQSENMHVSDFSVPSRGTLLLPRGQKRLGRYPPIQFQRPMQFQREKAEMLLKPKKELVKKDPTSKFSRATAPSGLLADLNPGIINRVRNSRQVHAIIEAVVGTDALVSSQESKATCPTETRSDPGYISSGSPFRDAAMEDGLGNLRSGSCASDCVISKRQLSDDIKPCNTQLHNSSANAELGPAEGFMKRCVDLKQNVGEQRKPIEPLVCRCQFCCPDESSGMDTNGSTSLSIKAANVASLWLDVNCQDLKGRIAALKRSKKRIRTAMKEKLGSIVNQTFSNCPRKDTMLENVERDHMVKWRSLFLHMDNFLDAEASQLEANLQNVRELMTHCNQGLQELHKLNALNIQQSKVLEEGFRSKQLIEKRFAIEAAAASIYSTANFADVSEDKKHV